MVGPPQEPPCGVSDYMHYVAEGLKRHADVAYICSPEEFHASHNRVDVVHLQHQYFVFGGLAPWRREFRSFASKVSSPAVMTVHEIVEPHGSAARRLALTWTNRLHFMRPAFRRLLVHTQSDAEKLAAMGIQAGRIRIVRHGVPPAPNLPDPIEAKRELGLEGKFVLTIFGFLSRKKGHLTAIEAMRHLPEEVTLLIAGGRHPSDRSGFPDMLERIAAERSLEGRVRVTGYLAREAVATTMAATDLVLAPFTESSGSGSLAMAFACGKPIVASDIGPHRELVDMQPGVMELAGHGDAAGLASAIEELRSSPERLRGLSECARALAGASSYEMIGARLVEIYREAIG